jgi:hypothetical protein
MKIIKQITEEEADDVYNAQGNETGEEGEEYNPSIFQELDELAFFFTLLFHLDSIMTEEECPPIP